MKPLPIKAKQVKKHEKQENIVKSIGDKQWRSTRVLPLCELSGLAKVVHGYGVVLLRRRKLDVRNLYRRVVVDAIRRVVAAALALNGIPSDVVHPGGRDRRLNRGRDLARDIQKGRDTFWTSTSHPIPVGIPPRRATRDRRLSTPRATAPRPHRNTQVPARRLPGHKKLLQRNHRPPHAPSIRSGPSISKPTPRSNKIPLDSIVTDAVPSQQRPQPAVLVRNTARGDLDLGSGLHTLEFHLAQAGLEVLDVLLTAGAGPTLIVADAGEVRAVLWLTPSTPLFPKETGGDRAGW